MTTVRLLEHNQGDKAALPKSGWDVACLTERSKAPAPGWAEVHRARRLKGLAIAWDPDVFAHRGRGSALAHPGLAGFSPNRGTIWDEFDLIGTPWKVAVVCSHRLNDPDGSTRAFGPIRRLLWKMHAALDARIFRRLERRGFLVLYGGDVNDRRCGLAPLVRELHGHYDAIGYSRDQRVRLVGVQPDRTTSSDHSAFTATFQIEEK